MNKRFGLEIEFGNESYNASVGDMRDYLQNYLANRYVKYPCFSNNQYQSNAWCLRQEHCGYELVTPPLKYADMDMVRKSVAAIDSIATLRIRPREMGMHVHVTRTRVQNPEMRMAGATLLWYAFEPLILRLVHELRQCNHWCRALSDVADFAPELEVVREAEQRRAAFAISQRHNTYEIRLHQATTNYRDIRAWVCLVMALIKEGETLGRRGMQHIWSVVRPIHNSTNRNAFSTLPLLRRILHHQLALSTAEMTWRNITNRLEA